LEELHGCDGAVAVVRVLAGLVVEDVATEREGEGGEAASVGRELVADAASRRRSREGVGRSGARGSLELLGGGRSTVEVDVTSGAQFSEPVDVVVEHLHRAVRGDPEAGIVEEWEQVGCPEAGEE